MEITYAQLAIFQSTPNILRITYGREDMKSFVCLCSKHFKESVKLSCDRRKIYYNRKGRFPEQVLDVHIIEKQAQCFFC